MKFRAWDNDSKKFVDDVLLTCNNYAFIYQYDGCEFYGEDRDIILMQYTGLKDKNGKEIYEGDIISDGYIKREVKYLGAGFSPFDEYLDVRDKFTILGGLYGFAVIGNIYENPELLENAG